MTKENKSKILTAVVIVFLCIIFFGGFAIGLNSVLSMEGSYPPNKLIKVPTPESKGDVISFLNKSVDYAISESPKISSERKLDISHKGSSYSDYIVNTDGSDQFTDTVKYIFSEIDDNDSDLYKAMLGKFESKSVDFGEDISNVIRKPKLELSDIKDFDIDYIYYNCSSCGENSDQPLDSCELCGSEMPYQLKYKDEFDITLFFDPSNNEILESNFAPINSEEAKLLFDNVLNNEVSISDVSLKYSDFSINFKVNRLKSEITYLAFNKVIDVDANMTMEGKFAALGSHKIQFTVESSERFKFTWPSLELSKDEIAIEPKGNDNLLATLTCNAPTEQDVIWTSSDENIVTVDNEGYFNAGKETGTAEITASFTFNGKTYSDTCKIDVKKSVESMKMSKRKIKLNTGDTFTLNAKVSPKDATIKTVTWYTENESIADVTKDGIVTAKNPGTVIVYALSDDGYFKSSCEVTVK